MPYTINKRNVIIAAIKSYLKVATHKYGADISTSIGHTISLDNINGNRLCKEALEKDMHNVSIAFEIIPTGAPVPVEWKKSSGHLIWNVKMAFTQKACCVKDGYRTPEPKESNYYGVVSRDSVKISLTYAALNDVDVTVADIKNSYLQAPSDEKHYVICGKYFGLEHEGKIALIRRAIYGGKLAGRDF